MSAYPYRRSKRIWAVNGGASYSSTAEYEINVKIKRKFASDMKKVGRLSA